MRRQAYNAFMKLPGPIQRPLAQAATKYYEHKINRLQTPLVLHFFITNRCNAKCGHCFYGDELNQVGYEMSLEEVERVARSLKHRLNSLLLTGGEPTLRKDLVDICVAFWKLNRAKTVTIPSNGLRPNENVRVVQEILQKTKMRVTMPISLDGIKEVHDTMRRVPGIFEKTIETARKLKEISHPRLNVFFVTSVSEFNYKQIPELMEYVQTNFDIVHKFQYVRGTGSTVFYLDKQYTNSFDPMEGFGLPPMDKLEDLDAFINSKARKDDISQKMNKIERAMTLSILKNKKRIARCLAGYVEGVLFPNGDVSLCELSKPVGNLKDFDFDFSRLWNSPKANEMRKPLSHCVCTHSCNLFNAVSYNPTKALEVMAGKV